MKGELVALAFKYIKLALFDLFSAKSPFPFQIELLDFKGEDLFEDGGIIRRIKQKGEGYSNPNEGATVESKQM